MSLAENPCVKLALCWGAVLILSYALAGAAVAMHFSNNKTFGSTSPSTSSHFQFQEGAPRMQTSGNFSGAGIFEDCDFADSGLPIQIPQALMLWLTVTYGILGVGRFVAGYTCFGVLQCLSCGCCGIWVIIDMILILTGGLNSESNGCLFYPNLTPTNYGDAGFSLLSMETAQNLINADP